MFHLIVDAFPHWMAYPMWKSITFECRNKYVSPLKHTESAKSTSVHSTEMAAAVVSSRPEKWMDWEGRDALRARLFFEAASTSTMSFLHSHTITLDRPPPVWRDFFKGSLTMLIISQHCWDNAETVDFAYITFKDCNFKNLKS